MPDVPLTTHPLALRHHLWLVARSGIGRGVASGGWRHEHSDRLTNRGIGAGRKWPRRQETRNPANTVMWWIVMQARHADPQKTCAKHIGSKLIPIADILEPSGYGVRKCKMKMRRFSEPSDGFGG